MPTLVFIGLSVIVDASSIMIIRRERFSYKNDTFAVRLGLEAGSLARTSLLGALFGFFTYPHKISPN